MIGHESGAILKQMQALLNVGTFGGLSDRELLEQFLERRDEVAELAFAVLVERHGPMVLGVCRRILRDLHDAEDAFQATFLVMVRRARSIRVEGSLGRWLFGVATRVATRARSDEHRRRARERSGLDRLEIAASDTSPAALDRGEIQAMIAREIAGLPARFQGPVLICDLEGRSYEEAARRLGWPVGTVKSRLSRARARLRERLARRGLGPAESSIVTAILPAAPPSSLVESTTHAALAVISGRLSSACGVSASVTTLTQGVLRTMVFTKFKGAAAALLMVATGSAVLFGQASAPKPGGRAGAVTSAKPGVSASASGEAVDLEMLERAWADAITRRDATVINRIMADDFEGIDQVGNIFTKAGYIPDLESGVFASAPIDLDEIKTRLFGETAVVTSRVKVRTWPMAYRMTNVYVKRQGHWQCVASHASWISAGLCPVADKTPGMDTFLKPRPYLARDPASRDSNQGTNCAVCHDVNRGNKPLPAPEAVAPQRVGEGHADKEIRVEINAQGEIKIQGRSVAAIKKDLEHWLKVGKEETGGTNLTFATAVGAPDRLVRMVLEAADSSIGVHEFSVERLKDPAKPPVPYDPLWPHVGTAKPAGQTSLIRPPFDCRVVEVKVNVGEAVKKGDPLLQVVSADLAAARGDYELAASQWHRDKKVYDYKKPLVDNNTMPRRELIDVENDEAQSRLKMKLARDKLLIFGLTEEEIARIGTEDDLERTRYTIRSRADGVVVAVDAVPGNDYDRKDVLIKIGPSTGAGLRHP